MKKLLIFTLIFFIFSTLNSVKALDVIAKSGSPQDIQEAVNRANAAGGGTVYVPEGTFEFNPPQVQWGCAVEVPGGVNVIGTGIGKTILKQTNAGTLTTYFFGLDGSNGKPIRISGFTFIVEPIDDDYPCVGITVDKTLNFRIDHISFNNFPSMGIYVEDSRGVVDHCIFDNPYKDNYQPHNSSGPYFAVWGYGIVITAPNMPWQNNISYYLGQYKDYIVYIEDCVFHRCRHSIGSNNKAWYAVRHCQFDKSSPYGQVDVHGGSPGGRGHEVYDNIFDLSDESYSLGQDSVTQPRGGGGIVWNNTAIINTNYRTPTVGMSNDGEDYPYDVRQYYIWNNKAYDHNGNPINFNDRIDPWYYQENVNYFLRAPNQQQDGFFYTPYTYPHPLTLEGLKYYVNLTGMVRDSSTGLALQGVLVSCNNTFSSETNSSGGYFISIPIAAPFSCNITVSKEGYLTNSSIVSFSSNGSYVRNFYIGQAKVSRISGRIVDKNNYPVQANVTIYQQGSSNVAASNKTDSNGYYYLTVSPGIYDVQFNFSSVNFVKLIAVNASGNVSNLIGKVSYENNKVVFEVENNYTKRIETYSEKKPSQIKLNKTSSPSWSYDSNKKMVGVNLSVVVAKSGSSQDIQEAVDFVASMGGGSVYIPEGNFTFKINYSVIRINNRYAGVQIPGGVNIFGAGANKTILYTPLSALDSSLSSSMFVVDGSNDKPVRISGITFKGSVNLTWGAEDDISLSGILLYGVKDYRIDHNVFLDFSSTAIGVSGNYVHKWNRGVIDHNIFDNPYKDIFWNYTGNLPYWGYGIIVGGDYPNYPSMEYYLGNYNNNTAFIEDNSFARHRHSVAMSAEGGWAVVRNNNFTTMIVSYYGSYIDAHGGARGYEVYNNVINNSPTDYRSMGNQSSYYGKYMGIGVNPRGGSGVIYNNKFINFDVGAAILLSNDQSNPTYRLNGFWVWNNTFINVTTQFDTSPGIFNITEGVEYFLYAKPGYTPYTYPHPLTLE